MLVNGAKVYTPASGGGLSWTTLDLSASDAEANSGALDSGSSSLGTSSTIVTAASIASIAAATPSAWALRFDIDAGDDIDIVAGVAIRITFTDLSSGSTAQHGLFAGLGGATLAQDGGRVGGLRKTSGNYTPFACRFGQSLITGSSTGTQPDTIEILIPVIGGGLEVGLAQAYDGGTAGNAVSDDIGTPAISSLALWVGAHQTTAAAETYTGVVVQYAILLKPSAPA